MASCDRSWKCQKQTVANFEIECRFSCDLTSKEGIKEVSDFVRSKETHLDILISNAGIRRDAPKPCNVLTAPLGELQASLWSSKYSDWTESFQVNSMAHYFLSVSLLDLLAAAADLTLPDGRKGKEVGRGSVVITSSCASMHNATNVDLTSYATTKAATDHLTALLAAKFARFYVRVNAINPGFVPSGMNPMNGIEGVDIFKGFAESLPAKRVGALEDIAGAILYLCSQAGVCISCLIPLCFGGPLSSLLRQLLIP